MNITKAKYIKSDLLIKDKSTSPQFRRSFICDEIKGTYILSAATLGYGRIYINGTEVSDNLFCSPVCDYRKTVWYRKFDVSKLLTKGKNTLAIWLGNGFYNESIASVWDTCEADWRDSPKLILSLDNKDMNIIKSDKSFLCKKKSAVFFNELRSGEYFDFNKYDENWTLPSFDDTDWNACLIDDTPPTGILRECECEPIREFEKYTGNLILKDSNRLVFDLKQNISGYAYINLSENLTSPITIRYREDISEKNELLSNDMEKFYPSHPFQTDKIIPDGERHIWHPLFTYHGFRYFEIIGIGDEALVSVEGVFVHQDVQRISSFECSDADLNKLFEMGIRSSWSNMFYALTDCPTREKAGWINDAQASAEQMLTNFDCEKLLSKWHHDICDAMADDGAMPGICPTWGWGYEWGNGPVSDGALFEIPYRIYLHSKNSKLLIDSIPFFEKYILYLDSRRSSSGLIEFGLWDWAGPEYGTNEHPNKTPLGLINSCFLVKFLRILKLSYYLCGKDTALTEKKIEAEKELIISSYIDSSGRCIVHQQTALALLINSDICLTKELIVQFKKLVEEYSFHIDCGMVGARHIFHALVKADLPDYAYKMLTYPNYPGYKYWVRSGATTLWEQWENKFSKNHHMHSDIISWMIKNILGINSQSYGYDEVSIKPIFPSELTYAKGHQKTIHGEITVEWRRINGNIHISICIPKRVSASFFEKKLQEGTNCFIL